MSAALLRAIVVEPIVLVEGDARRELSTGSTFDCPIEFCGVDRDQLIHVIESGHVRLTLLPANENGSTTAARPAGFAAWPGVVDGCLAITEK